MDVFSAVENLRGMADSAMRAYDVSGMRSHPFRE
jgi:hypothetical protein